MSKKEYLILVIVVAVAVSLGNLGSQLLKTQIDKTDIELGSAFDDRNNVTVIGSSSNLVSLPVSGVNANTTTTDATSATQQSLDGGSTIQQLIQTGGVRKVVLNISAVGGTATSTMYITQKGSHDGTNYFDIISPTTTDNIVGTSTPVLVPKAVDFDPGIATTTYSIPWTIDGYRYTRFIIYTEDLTTDGVDGVQAWITATLIRDKEF